MTTEMVVEDRADKRRYTRATWVKFSPAQRSRLEEIAVDWGMSLAQVVRQATVVQLELPRESKDFDD